MKTQIENRSLITIIVCSLWIMFVALWTIYHSNKRVDSAILSGEVYKQMWINERNLNAVCRAVKKDERNEINSYAFNR